MWVQTDSEGKLARDDSGNPIPIENGSPIPRCFVDPEVTPRQRRTDTNVRDEYVVHFTGRTSEPNDNVPGHLRDADPGKRIRQILADNALMAIEPFGRHWVYPSICFCEGNQGARAALIEAGKYRRFGIAFHREAVERWGARPLIYADADIIYFIRQVFRTYHRDYREDLTSEEKRRLDVVRSLLVRDWPGTEEGQDFFRDHGLDYDIKNQSEWSHEREMRLILHTSASGWQQRVDRAYWTFNPESVAHLLLPADQPEPLADFAEAVAESEETSWAADIETRLLNPQGLPEEVGPLNCFR